MNRLISRASAVLFAAMFCGILACSEDDSSCGDPYKKPTTTNTPNLDQQICNQGYLYNRITKRCERSAR